MQFAITFFKKFICHGNTLRPVEVLHRFLLPFKHQAGSITVINLLNFCTQLKSVASPWQLKLSCSLENWGGMFEFADPENSTFHAKKLSISSTELQSVQCCPILPTVGCHGNSFCRRPPSGISPEVDFHNSVVPEPVASLRLVSPGAAAYSVTYFPYFSHRPDVSDDPF